MHNTLGSSGMYKSGLKMQGETSTQYSEVPAVPAETLLDSKRQDVITVQMDLNNMTRARGRIIIFYT